MLLGLALSIAIVGSSQADYYVPGFFDSRYLEPEINQVIDHPDRVTVVRCTIPFGFRSLVEDKDLGYMLLGPRRKVERSDADEIRKIMRLPVDPKREGACTFSADHIVRFERGKRRVEIVTCFKCSANILYIDGKSFPSSRHSGAQGDPIRLRAVLNKYNSEYEKALLPYFREHETLFVLSLEPPNLKIDVEGRKAKLPSAEVKKLFQILFCDLSLPKTPMEPTPSRLPAMVIESPGTKSRLVIDKDLDGWVYESKDSWPASGRFGKWRGEAYAILSRALSQREPLFSGQIGMD